MSQHERYKGSRLPVPAVSRPNARSSARNATSYKRTNTKTDSNLMTPDKAGYFNQTHCTATTVVTTIAQVVLALAMATTIKPVVTAFTEPPAIEHQEYRVIGEGIREDMGYEI